MSRKNRGPGRPPVFVGPLLRTVVKTVRQHKNATHARQALADSGVNISMPTLRNIASEAGIEFQMGRPRKVA
jgi:hypothetical protein